MVGRSPAAEHQPPVCRSLPVDDQVPQVVERRPGRQADLLKHGLGKRRRRHDQGVDRHDRALVACQPCCVAFGGADDVPCPDCSSRGDQPSWLEPLNLGLLIDQHAPGPQHVGQAAGEPGGMDGRAVRREHTAQHAGDTAQLARHGRRQQPEVGVIEAVHPGLVDLVLRPLQLRGRARELDGSALGPVAVDCLVRHYLPDLVDRLLHRPVHRDRWLAARHPLKLRQCAEHQPPLRPDAPNPAISRSQSTIRSSGLAMVR